MVDAQDLVAMADIARLSGQSRATVGNWKRRYADTFPQERTRGPRGPLYDRADVLAWLEAEGKLAAQPNDDAALVWRMRESLRDAVAADEAVFLILVLLAMRADISQDSWNKLQQIPQDDVVSALRSEVDSQFPFASGLLRSQAATGKQLSEVLSDVSRIRTESLSAVADSLFESISEAGPTRNGEWVLPTSVVQLAVALAEPAGTVYNPASGLGQVLVGVGRDDGGAVTKLFGQEASAQDWSIGELNLALHQVPADVALGDVLTDDTYPDLLADRVIAFPPWNLRLKDTDILRDDPRWIWGEPGPQDGNAAWIQHCLYHLAEDGRAVIGLPMNVLFEGGRSGRIRHRIIKAGLLEAVIGLPPGLFAATNLASCLLVFAKGRPTEGGKPAPTLMINLADEMPVRRSRRTSLTAEQTNMVVRLLGMWRDGETPSEPTAAVATYDDMAANDFVLDPSRYIALPQAFLDLDEVHQTRNTLLAELSAATDAAREADEELSATSAVLSVTTPEMLRLGDLSHSLSIKRGFPTFRASQDADVPVLSVADLRHGKPARHFADREDCADLAIEPARPGDILISIEGGTVGQVFVVPDGLDDFVPSQQAATLRVLDLTKIDPWYLAAWLSAEVGSGELRRLARGGGIQRIAIKHLVAVPVPVPPLAVQHQIARRLSAFEAAKAAHAAAAMRIGELRDLDLAITFNEPAAAAAPPVTVRRETNNDGS